MPYAGGIGGVEHHCDSSEAYYAHTPGLKVVTPATVEDAYSLLREAIADPDPVIFMEPKRLYWSKAEVELPVSAAPFGTAAVRREGRDVTLVAYGPSVPVALEAAEAATDEGWDVEVVDLRTIVPFDDETVVASVRRTGRCVVIQEAQGFGGVGAEIASRVQERALPRPARPGAAGQRAGRPLPRAQARARAPARCRPGAGRHRAAAVGRRAGPALRRRRCRMSVATAVSPAVFLLPDLGEGLTEAEVMEWHVAVGDEVVVDQVVVTVETAKATVDLPCPHAGRVHQLYGEPGQLLAVGSPLLSVATAGSVPDRPTPPAR